MRHTSKLDNKSLSGNSETPISRADASAKATPTVFTPPSRLLRRTAITIGALSKSVLENNKSSTSCRLPGDARRTSSQRLPDALLPLPPSGAHISIRSCRVVSASRRKILATVEESVTEGSESLPLPSCLMTERVWYT
jgi:hypothetical protein